MLIATFIVCYRLFSFSQTRFSHKFLKITLWSLMAFVVVAQNFTGESTVQQVVFTLMAYWLWHTSFKLITNTVTNPVLKSKMRYMAISGIAFFISGHLCWMTDYYACQTLRSMRTSIGMPWAAVLELHG
jgi:dihydroceramidase